MLSFSFAKHFVSCGKCDRKFSCFVEGNSQGGICHANRQVCGDERWNNLVLTLIGPESHHPRAFFYICLPLRARLSHFL